MESEALRSDLTICQNFRGFEEREFITWDLEIAMSWHISLRRCL